MKDKRLSLYQYLINPDNFEEGKPLFSGSFTEFETKFFSSVDTVKKIYEYTISHKGKDNNWLFNGTLDAFYKKFVCDLEFAKSSEYCKEAPLAKEKNKWYDATDDNKEKFKSKYPCIRSMSINGAKQKEIDEGTIIVLNVTINNEKVLLFMLDSTNPELTSKYNGLVKKEDGSDEGKFSCKGGIINTQ
jgi:hypothetical protein